MILATPGVHAKGLRVMVTLPPDPDERGGRAACTTSVTHVFEIQSIPNHPSGMEGPWYGR